jgi:hypothetical protein
MDQNETLGVQADEMGAVFSMVSADATIYAEEVRIRTVDALSKRDTYLGHREMAGVTDGEKVLAQKIVRATFERRVIFYVAINPAAHEDVRMSVLIRFDLLERFVHPVDTVSAVNHLSFP